VQQVPQDDKERKAIPLYTGCIKYFPLALIEVAKISKKGNDQHNPGQPLHWAREKSSDHLNSAQRHMVEADTDIEHAAALAWRALANLQELCENERQRSSQGSDAEPEEG
jgi:hypothetical protein